MFPIWRFLKIEGTPCHHPVIDAIFHYLSCYWGTPTDGPPLPSWSIPDFFGRTMLDQNVFATVGCGCFAKETDIHSKPLGSPKLNRFGEFWVPHFRNKYGWQQIWLTFPMCWKVLLTTGWLRQRIEVVTQKVQCLWPSKWPNAVWRCLVWTSIRPWGALNGWG